jgi:hypothetical protein
VHAFNTNCRFDTRIKSECKDGVEVFQNKEYKDRKMANVEERKKIE